MLGPRGASGPHGPDLDHMYLIYGLIIYDDNNGLYVPCNGQSEVTTHATCLLHVTSQVHMVHLVHVDLI